MDVSQPTPLILPLSGHRSDVVSQFLVFLLDARNELTQNSASPDHPDVARIRRSIEEHYIDDHGKPAMYLEYESALYDDAPQMVTLWTFFDRYDKDQLRTYRRLIQLEHDGLTGDRSPRKIFDRSPFGIAAIIAGTITVWMTVLRTYTGDDLSDLLEIIRFNWIAGAMWITGLFVTLWYILKTMRNNRQVAVLSSISRALDLYLEDGAAEEQPRTA